MKKKDFYWIIASVVLFPFCVAGGTAMVLLSESNRLTAFGWALILIGIFFLILLLPRIPVMISARKERKYKLKKKREEEEAFRCALAAFEQNDYPELNTVRLVNTGMEFFAKGRYILKKDFKDIPGNHFAFEINSIKLKFKPENYDDVCDFEWNGVFIEAGYFERTALADENDNGILLQDTPENLIGQTITLKQDEGYILYLWTVDGDEIDYGFLKILKYENDVLTVYFSLNVPAGLCDTVEGTVELKKDTMENASDIHTLISIIKRRPYNTIKLKDEEIENILRANPFLPDGYIAFIREVGFADLDWIDVGRNVNTPANLYDDTETGYIDELLSAYAHLNRNDFYFFAVDGSDSYYAFSKKPDDERVYAFSNDAPFLTHYENFEIFLNEILNV